MMRYIIDRFEGIYAVCEQEDQTMINIEKNRLPKGVREGDALIQEGDSIVIDPAQTEERKRAIRERMEKLWD